MQEAKSSKYINPKIHTPCQRALLLTTGIHSIARLALAVSGSDVSDMNSELKVDLNSNMSEADWEDIFVQCIEIIESSNRRMLSVIIERNNSIEERFSKKIP